MSKKITAYLEKMKAIQTNILQYLEGSEDLEENYENIIKSIDDNKIIENQHELKPFLHLLVKIANNHHRKVNFFEKIEKFCIF